MTQADKRNNDEAAKLQTYLRGYSATQHTSLHVRAPPAPHLIPELMAYMATIVRVSQDFAGLAWVRYDAAFRRQAALTRNERWTAINSTLYTMEWHRRRNATRSASPLLTQSRSTCAQRSDPDPGMKDGLKAVETAVLAITDKRDVVGKQQLPAVLSSGETCRKWNSVGCSYPWCQHTHACSNCGGAHLALKCTMRPSYPGQGTPGRGIPSMAKPFVPPQKQYHNTQ